ncbi:MULTISPECIES: putative Ig domain-containing protein, partial [unclassified Anabaena]|uniref:putative Ig domain-containing protein n=1 Tax=unclassified Anabaena TaxID=2619674 RepID=UPI0018D2FCFF
TNINGTLYFVADDGTGEELWKINGPGVNSSPIVANAIADQTATANSVFTFQFANNAFSDVEDGTNLTYTATLADDSPLPAWLTFNPDTRTFSGETTTADTYTIKVTATDTANATVSDEFVLTFKNLISGATADRDILRGSNNDDIINGGEGNDYLLGGGGKDDLDGGTGNDYVFGGAGDDIINGGDDAGFDLLYGNEGNDTLDGGDGDDNLDGGTGDDSLVGGTGNDNYTVDSVGDTVVENDGEGRDKVNSFIDYTLGNHLENLTLLGNAANGIGNSLNNHIIGNNAVNTLDGDLGDDWLMGKGGNDTLYGGDGNDRLDGGSGDDSLVGGADNDIYEVDSAGDTIVELADEGIDTVISIINFSLGDNVENLTLVRNAIIGLGNELDNRIFGNNQNNVLVGLEGDDFLSGGAGEDFLVGGIGYDTLDGGRGADIFDLTGFLDDGSFDTIKDFRASDGDIIQLSASELGITAEMVAANNWFTLGTSATETTHRFIYDQTTGGLFYDADGSGDTAQVQVGLFSNRAVLTAASFNVVAAVEPA